MPWAKPPEDPRVLTDLREQFAVEKELAARLRRAGTAERAALYGEVYDELFRRLPHQPQLAQRAAPEAQAELTSLQTALLEPFLSPETVFVEVGSGDSCLALHLASRVQRVVAVEASSEITRGIEAPPNFELVLAKGPDSGLSQGFADLAFSCHFIEHLHPEDALIHAREMARILRPGGVYVCVTPNRIYGPHDVSRYFADQALGLHLREYTHGELARLLRKAGFARVGRLRGIGGPPELCRPGPAAVFEAVADLLPVRLRRRLLALYGRGSSLPFRPLEQVMLAAFVEGG